MSARLPAESGCGNLLSDCSAVGLYCITITWQQIFKSSLQVQAAVVGVLPHVTVELRYLGR